jgi:hypothetical protein
MPAKPAANAATELFGLAHQRILQPLTVMRIIA